MTPEFGLAQVGAVVMDALTVIGQTEKFAVFEWVTVFSRPSLAVAVRVKSFDVEVTQAYS
jgi:hypothetical protein